MNTNNIDDLSNFNIEDFLREYEHEILYTFTPEIVDELDELLGGEKARKFTEMMNKKYEEENQVDDQGQPLRLEVPSNILKRSYQNRDGSMSFSLTPAEDRWFRADCAFGHNLLEKLGLTYVEDEE